MSQPEVFGVCGHMSLMTQNLNSKPRAQNPIRERINRSLFVQPVLRHEGFPGCSTGFTFAWLGFRGCGIEGSIFSIRFRPYRVGTSRAVSSVRPTATVLQAANIPCDDVCMLGPELSAEFDPSHTDPNSGMKTRTTFLPPQSRPNTYMIDRRSCRALPRELCNPIPG